MGTDIAIKPLSVETLPDFLHFFDNAVFSEHPNWSVCYCYSFHFVGSGAEWNDKEKNRSAVIELVKTRHMHGYLAYSDRIPVGWCNANDKRSFERLRLNSFEWIWDDSPGQTCSVVCFLIDPRHRGKGIASALLDRACVDYRERGYAAIEAYPSTKKGSAEDQCNGPLSMYLGNGFQMIREQDDAVLVRKKLSSED